MLRGPIFPEGVLHCFLIRSRAVVQRALAPVMGDGGERASLHEDRQQLCKNIGALAIFVERGRECMLDNGLRTIPI